jgi:DNA-binding MarR family transcriptional regulator
VGRDELATDAWELLRDYLFHQRDRFLRVAHGHGLSPGDVRALMYLDVDAPLAMGSLAQHLGCDASTATWIVDRLEERGLAERRPSPGDRRKKTVVPTPAGIRVRDEIRSQIDGGPDLLGALAERDLHDLVRVMRKLHAALPVLPPDDAVDPVAAC